MLIVTGPEAWSSVTEALRATRDSCSLNYLHIQCLLERKHRDEHQYGSHSPSYPMNTMITIYEDKSVYVSTKIVIDEMTKLKQWQKSSKDNNVERILTKVKWGSIKKRQSTAL